MATAYLYKKGIPRNIKFYNKDNLAQYLAYDTPSDSVNVEGCSITNTTSYIDIEVTPSFGRTQLLAYSYIRIPQNNSLGVDITYLAYIDRVEPSNFNNSEKRYFRLFITIDWWSTLLLVKTEEEFENQIIDKLEGTVVRAHVNDVKSVDGGYIADLSNTLVEQEFPIARYKKTSYRLQNNTVKFLYILSSQPLNSRPVGSRFTIGERSYDTPLYLYITPLGGTITAKYNFVRDGEHITRMHLINNSTITTPEVLDDSSIISMYCSDVCPLYDESNKILEFNAVYDIKVNDVWLSDLPRIMTFSGTHGLNIFAFECAGNMTPTSFNNTNVPFNGIIRKRTTYADYLDFIPKQYHAPYVITSLENGSSYPIDTAFTTTPNIFTYNILPEQGGLIISDHSETKNGEARINCLIDGSVFTPIGIDDELTALKRSAMQTQYIASTLSSAGKLATSIVTVNAKGIGQIPAEIAQTTANTMNTYADMKRSIRDGEVGFSPQASATNAYINPPVVCVRRPFGSTLGLRRDLALYGYNTFLHPHDILNSHKREYFNYIKLSSASINTLYLNTEIKLQLEEMFNNGVWLWNTNEEFGNFEVPNYPMLMEE